MNEDSSAQDAANENVDRIVIRRVENDLLQGWVNGLNARFDGMIRVTKSDLANFLIRQHDPSLSDAEAQSIQAELYDETRWLNWAIAKLRQAKKDGASVTLNDLMMKRDLIATKDAAAKPRPRTRRKKAPVAPALDDAPNYSDLEEG